MQLLITGAGGYIGSVLTETCIQKGFKVIALDRYFFGVPFQAQPGLSVLKDDVRTVSEEVFRGVDAVIDLAALSNDPAGDLDPDLTDSINHLGRVRIARLAKACGVSRYILASSCSVYGNTGSQVADENTPPNPLTCYARANLNAERAVFELGDRDFLVTSLRLATVYGLSKRMRFDLVVNLMTLKATQTGKILVFGGGTHFRPLVHVRDVAKAFLTVLEAEPQLVNKQVFNVGSNEQNHKIIGLAYIVREALPFHVEICVDYNDPDKRNYLVNFDKVHKELGFSCNKTIHEGVAEIYNALKQGRIDTSLRTSTVAWYKYLLEADKVLAEVKLNDRLLT